MSSPRYPGFDTLALRAGGAPVPLTPNPAVAALEVRIAALDGGVAGIATAGGQAALHLGLATIAAAGSHIVASNALSGAACRLLAHTLKRFGVETTFVDPRDIDAWRAAIRPETRLLFGAASDDLGLHLLDIPRVAALAHENDVPLLVDASLATPWLLQPAAHGAALVMHAARPFLGGHGCASGGLLVDGGNFDWQAAHARTGRFAALCEPDDAFGGMVFVDESTVGAFALRARHEGVRGFGAAMHPHDAGAILQGIETLGLRMERHVANTRKLADFLARHAAVASVAYPELDGHPDRALAATLMPRGCGAVFGFTLRGDRAAATRFVDGLRLFSNAAEVGGARSAAHAIDAGTIRLSVGLDDADDLLDDLARALKLAQKGT